VAGAPAVAVDALETGRLRVSELNEHRRVRWPGHGCAKDVGWMQKCQPPTTDATAEFVQLDAAVKSGENVLPSDAKDYVYLIVGGLFTGLWPRGLYLHQNLEALKSAGLDARRASIDTDQSVEHNAAIIRKSVLAATASGKKVVLIGHSEGGLHAAAALALYPELKGNVRALVTIQAPLGGSPIASDLEEVPGLEAVAGKVLDLIGGSILSWSEMDYESRREFMAQHPMPPGIPTVCMASSKRSLLAPLYAAGKYIKSRYGVDSDGLVIPEDAFLPGSRTVMLAGLDHADTTVTKIYPFPPYRPRDLTLALVGLALREPTQTSRDEMEGPQRKNAAKLVDPGRAPQHL